MITKIFHSCRARAYEDYIYSDLTNPEGFLNTELKFKLKTLPDVDGSSKTKAFCFKRK